MKSMPATLAAVLLALTLAAGCERFARPKTWDEIMAVAATHHAAGRYEQVFKECQRALEIVDKVGNGQRAVSALDCIAEMARKAGKAELALPHYATVFGTYDKDLRVAYGRFRIRNNHAVTLFAAGKKAEAIQALSDTIDAWDGTPYSTGTPNAFTVRMLLVRNLARAARSDLKGKIAEWLVTTEADAILENFSLTSPNGVHLAMNGADALAAIADLAGARDDPARAATLREAADARKAEETPFLEANPAIARRCEEAGTMSLKFTACFEVIP